MKSLLLIPTDFERRLLLPQLSLTDLTDDKSQSVVVELCGFGLAASGILATRHIIRHQPDQVVLAGIAGALSTNLTIGHACTFQRVAVHGIGAGEGPDFQSAGQLGWPQVSVTEQHSQIGDVLALKVCQSELTSGAPMQNAAGQMLLSVCAASASERQAEHRRRLFPQAVAEDMEGFSVAMACQLAGLGCYIVRGLSNFAGDRDHQNWLVSEALCSTVPMLQEILK